MCGFLGRIAGAGTSMANDFAGALKQIEHRGPDDNGIYEDAGYGVQLGFNRLAILDLSDGGHQPMLNERGDLCLLFNGEIYNYQEIRIELASAGFTFRSRSDSEVLLNAFDHWGDECVERLRGMFAFAVWDIRKRELTLVRDRLGIKPLYYCYQDGILAFASEAKALLALGVETSIKSESIAQYLMFPYLPDSSRTMLEGIRKLEAAHILKFSNDRIMKRQYWSAAERVGENSEAESVSDAALKLDELMSRSVELRMISDVPIGVMLSGGLDSSYVTALASKSIEQPLHTFTIGHEHALDERKYARTVADHFSTIHTELPINLENIFERLPRFVEIFDDLSSSDGGFVSLFLMFQQIKSQGIKVLLLGDGADELFAGYSWFNVAKHPFSLLPRKQKVALIYHAFAKQSFYPWAERGITSLDEIFGHEGSFFDQIERFEISNQLPNHFLMKVDKSSMANSIEARVPFLDHKVVEYARRIGPNLKLRGKFARPDKAREKWVLRRAASTYLPKAILERKKRGFLLSVPALVEKNLDKVLDLVCASGSISRHYIEPKVLSRIKSKSNISILEKQRLNLLWKLLLLELWRDNVLAKYSIEDRFAK